MDIKGNVMFICGCYPEEYTEYFVNNSKVMPQNAANVLSWRLIEGFDENIPNNINVLTCPFIGYYPKQFKKLFIRDQNWAHNGKDSIDKVLGFFNIKGLETYIKSVRIYKHFKKWYQESEQNRYVLFYSHYAGFMRAAGKIKRKFKDVHITCLVTEMNELDERKDLEGIKGKIKGIPRGLMIQITYKNLKYIDSFVLLAERMKEYLGVDKRPYVVVEGIINLNLTQHKQNTDTNQISPNKNEFRVVYTGTLHKRYGLLMLIDSFEYIEDKSINLYICGDGDGKDDIIERCKSNSAIHYMGIIKHEDAVKLQASADLLVNSMPNFGKHTALSFPSKTMEYMISKKPVVCFKVEGIPNEYDTYLEYFEEENPKSIAKKIIELRNKEREELDQMGTKNREFVIKNKTPKMQVAKILKMMFGES